MIKIQSTVRIAGLEVHLLSGGQFSLDPGAYFGIVPKPLWSRRFKLNSKGRIDLSTNVILATGSDFSALIDSGVGHMDNSKLEDIFEVRPNPDFIYDITNYVEPGKIDYILQSHMHFDHMGNSYMVGEDGRPCFHSAKVVVQKMEMVAFRHPNEFTRGNYMKTGSRFLTLRTLNMDGSGKIRDSVRVVLSGGHSPGHQVIILGSGSSELIYFGDLIPSSFHVKLPYVTAIDVEPLETIRKKKVLLRKAIRDHAVCVFNHDPEVPAAILSGDLQNLKLEPVLF